MNRSLLVAMCLSAGSSVFAGNGNAVTGFYEDFERTGEFFRWGENTVNGTIVEAPAMPGQSGTNHALRIGPFDDAAIGNLFLGASITFPRPAPGEDIRRLLPVDDSVHVSAAFYVDNVAAGLRVFEVLSVNFLAVRIAWGGTCVDSVPGECEAAGLPIGALSTLHYVELDPPALAEASDNGQPIHIPENAWFRLGAEFTTDGRVLIIYDGMDGAGVAVVGESTLLEYPAIGVVLIAAGGGDHTMYVDNIRAVGPTPGCLGDVNRDGAVTFYDLNLVLSDYGQSGSRLAPDTNIDGVVNFSDLNATLSDFGNSCPVE